MINIYSVCLLPFALILFLGSGCMDMNPYCPNYVAYCRMDPRVQRICPKTCNLCGGCIDVLLYIVYLTSIFYYNFLSHIFISPFLSDSSNSIVIESSLMRYQKCRLKVLTFSTLMFSRNLCSHTIYKKQVNQWTPLRPLQRFATV